MNRSFFAAALCAAAAGCATNSDFGHELLRKGDLRGAEQQFAIAAREGDGAAWTNLALIYHRQGRLREAVDAMTMGARYGDPSARAALAKAKLPVPPPDLAARRAAPSTEALGEILGAGVRGYQGGGTTLPYDHPTSTTCDVRQTSMGPSMMNKSYQVNCQ